MRKETSRKRWKERRANESVEARGKSLLPGEKSRKTTRCTGSRG